MGFDQYHEPPEELSQETRTMARMFASMTEEAEAINWYEQRLAIAQGPDARKIIEDARHEEYKHFAMDFEFLLRKRTEWRAIAEAGWQDIDEETRARATPGLAARRTVDFRGPHGWETSAASLGRVGDRD